MKIIYVPNSNESNKYIELMKNATKKVKNNISFSSLREGVRPENFNKKKYICLNWFESLSTQNNLKFYSNFFRKIIRLSIFKFFNIKIIFVFHNKIPHETKNKNISLFLIKKLLLNSYKIIIHCRESEKILKEYVDFEKIKFKINYVPHPNYIGAYPEDEIKEDEIKKDEIKKDEIKFLFIGNIRKYKNIELLIDVFNKMSNEDITLKIVGYANDELYKEELIKRVKSKNIKLDFKYVPDEKIVKEIQENDILILPYNLESALNSGVIILAFSNKKTIVSSNIPMLKDIKNQQCFYKYNYSSKEEEEEELLKQINNVILDYNENKNSLKYKGMKLYEEMSEFYSLEKVTEHLKKVYQ